MFLPLNVQDERPVADEIVQKGRELAIELGPRFLAAVAILVIGWIVARIVARLLRRLLEKGNVDPTLTLFLGNVAYLGLLAFVLVAAISKLGVETASLVAALGAAGFAIGFALQGSLSNFAAGIMLMIFRPLRAGDLVEAGGALGTVQEVGVFATTLHTPDNRRVTISNSSVTGANIVNYTINVTRRVDLVFGISYDDDVQLAKQVIQEVLDRDPRILKEPATVIGLGALADSSVNLFCRPWVNAADYWPVVFDTNEAVKRAFGTRGIHIPYPQRDVHLFESKSH